MRTQEERATLVRRIQLAAVKARSIAAEMGTLELAKELTPAIHGEEGLAILPICELMLEEGREISQMDMMNLLAVCHSEQAFGFESMFFIRWEEDLPSPMDVWS